MISMEPIQIDGVLCFANNGVRSICDFFHYKQLLPTRENSMFRETVLKNASKNKLTNKYWITELFKVWEDQTMKQKAESDILIDINNNLLTELENQTSRKVKRIRLNFPSTY